MSVLVPMPSASFPAFLEAAIANYADENIASGRWSAEAALELSRAEHERLLPEGFVSKDNHFFEVHDPKTDAVVGSLWLGVQNKTGVPLGYVLQIGIHPAHRRQGHATRALKELESVVRELGFASIGLNVFGFNIGAQSLYSSLGYEVVGISMRKSLSNEGIC